MHVKTNQMLSKAVEWLLIKDPDAFLAFRHRRIPMSWLPFSTSKPPSHGGITICFLVEPTEGIARFSLALCSNKDNFSKDMGRQIAFGRLTLEKSRYTILDYTNEEDLMGQARNILLDCYEVDPLAKKVIDDYESLLY